MSKVHKFIRQSSGAITCEWCGVAPSDQKPGCRGDLPSLAMRLYHQRDRVIGPTKLWCCEATVSSSKTSLKIELIIDTECSCELALPKKILEMLGARSRGEGQLRATSAKGELIVERYEAVHVAIPLLVPSQEEGHHATRDTEVDRRESLDTFSLENQKEGESLINMFAPPEEPESKEAQSSSDVADIPDVPAVPLQLLNHHRHHLKSSSKDGLVALLGLPGLQKLALALSPEMRALLPIQLPPHRLVSIKWD